MKAMNLTNSSTESKRRELDFYPTPPEATQALIDFGVVPPGRVWEPACGEGHMAEVFRQNGFAVLATDIRETGYGSVANFLSVGSSHGASSIITNPPFNISAEFIEHAIKLEVPVVAMLLKSQYWHAAKRAALFEKYPPAYILALTWRLDFMMGERGGSPTMECLWSVWIEGDTDTKYRLLKKPTIGGTGDLFGG